MAHLDSFPFKVIKKLIVAEMLESHPEYDIEFGPMKISDVDYDEDNYEATQFVEVMLHINTYNENDKAQCWHPWLFVWDCDRSEFSSIMRDDQTQQIEVYEELKNKEEWSTDKSYDKVIDFAPIHSIHMHVVLDNNDPVYKFEDGAQPRTIMDVLNAIYDHLYDHMMNDRYEGHDVVIDKLHVHDDGNVYVTFSRLDDEEQEG